MEAVKRIPKDWFSAFNAHNTDTLVSLYSIDAQHFSPNLQKLHPETKGLIIGKDALYSWWSEAFERFPDLQYTPLSIDFQNNNNTVYLRYLRTVGIEPDREVNEVLEIESGKIVFSKVL
jgi:hypothetical protein